MTDAVRAGYQPQLSLRTIFGFAISTLPGAALAMAMQVFLSPYLATHLGVPLTIIGAAFGIVRLLDIGVDPVLGALMDRTHTPWGRYRVWILASIPILMLTVYMLYMAPFGIGLLYLVGWLLVYYVGYSILVLSQSAWTATLATNYHERSRVFGIMAAVAILGALAVLLIPIVSSRFGIAGANSVPAMGWFIMALIPLSVGFAAATTPETVTRDLQTQRFPLADYWALIRKPSTIRLCLGQLAVALGPNWMSALYIFFFTASRGYTTEQASIMLAVYIVSGVAGAPSTGRLAMRIGKHRALMVMTTAYSLGLCTVMMFPKHNLLAMLPVMIWCGFTASGFNLMISAMAGDLGDEIRLEQGNSQTSLVFALLQLMVKLAAAFSFILTYDVLAAVGYKATLGAANSPAAINGLNLVFLFGPIFFVTLGAACFIGWRLDATRHGDIRRELDERDAALDALVVVGTITIEDTIVSAKAGQG